MNSKLSPDHLSKKMLINILSLLGILLLALPVIQIARAVTSSPFLGQWQTTDVDGADIRLTVSGPSGGPLQISWREIGIGLCNNEAGIVFGTAQLDEGDPNLLEADLHVECLTSAAASDFHFLWRYHPLTKTLSGKYDNGVVTVWHRPDRLLPSAPALNLRVNYGDNWVEGFHEAGHIAWITVTESDGVTVRATARLITEPKDSWEGEPGFQTTDSVWLDADANPMETPPDIQPYDWVFGWLDNGTGAQVQIGEIRGVVNLATESIEGSILAPWISDPVHVECLDWGSGGNSFDKENKNGGLLLTNGANLYSCSWVGEWDIQFNQNVGVGYFTSDGQWVANAFSTNNPIFVAYVPNAIEGYDWTMGSTITIDINDGEYTAQAISEQRPGFPEGETRALFELWKDNFSMETGDLIVMTDGVVKKEVIITNLSVSSFDVSAGTISGLYEPGYDLWVWLYDRAGQVPTTDVGNGTWMATFDQLQGGAIGGASQQDTDGDRVSIDFQIAETLLVTSTSDVIANDGLCTLREAIIAANTNAPSGAMSGECPAGMNSQTDTVILVAGNTYSLTIDRTNNDTEADGDLDIRDNSAAVDLLIMVEGNGRATIVQDAVVDDRVLENHGATVQIKGLTLTGGSNVWSGGGVQNYGNLALNNTSITGNSASVHGGGVWNEGTLTLTNSTLANNIAPAAGGGIHNLGPLTVENSTLTENSASQGGALYNTEYGTAIISQSNVLNGSASDGGGGLFNLGTMTVDSSTVTGNRAPYGGGLFNWIGGMLTISNSTISNNWANEGGGLHNKEHSTVVIQNGTVFSGNYAEWSAGGIDNWGKVTITDSVLRENTTPGEAGDALASGVSEDSETSITGSCIVGNGDTALFTNHLAPLHTTGNWWGAHSGPTHRTNPGGIGDSVSDFVDFSGWLTEPPSVCAPGVD